jgi:hypothetical protein
MRTKSVAEVEQALRACGMEFSSVRVPFRDRYTVSVQLAPDTEYGYDKLSELTKLLGTTDLCFVWYSEWTDSGDRVQIDIRWPAHLWTPPGTTRQLEINELPPEFTDEDTP